MIPADHWLGIATHRFSPGVREMCCRESLHCSFEVSAENIFRLSQLAFSDETVRTIVENQGRVVLSEQRSGSLRPGFTSDDCTGQTVITGTDGVMVPMVTEEQKQKRRQTESGKRKRQKRRSTARRGRPRRGSDGPYKEYKVLSFYDPDKEHCHVVGTSGNHKTLGHLMRREGSRLAIDRAKTKYAVTDGATWIAKQYASQLPMLDEHILDYFHMKEHVVLTSQVLYGESTRKAQEWRDDMLGYIWNQGSLVMLDKLGNYLRRHRSGAKQEALKSLREYVGKRIAMTDYPTFRALGYDCGSGPTESLCGTLTERLKGPGMRWDKDNAESVMSLASIYRSGLWDSYWKAQRNAA